jgi:hypothetical protein
MRGLHEILQPFGKVSWKEIFPQASSNHLRLTRIPDRGRAFKILVEISYMHRRPIRNVLPDQSLAEG